MTWGLPPLSQSYVIRPDAMNFLLRHLIRNYDEAQKIAIVSGIPGGGKTQLVTKFAQEYYHVYVIATQVALSHKSTDFQTSSMLMRAPNKLYAPL